MQRTHCTGCLQSHNRQSKSYSGCVNLGNSKMLSDFWSEHWQLKSGSLGLVPSDSSLFIFLYCTTYYSWGIPFKLLWLRAESQNLLAKYSVGLYSRSRHRYFIKVLQANVPNVLTFKKVMYLNTFRRYPHIILKVRLGPRCQYSLHNLEMTPEGGPH